MQNTDTRTAAHELLCSFSYVHLQQLQGEPQRLTEWLSLRLAVGRQPWCLWQAHVPAGTLQKLLMKLTVSYENSPAQYWFSVRLAVSFVSCVFTWRKWKNEHNQGCCVFAWQPLRLKQGLIKLHRERRKVNALPTFTCSQRTQVMKMLKCHEVGGTSKRSEIASSCGSHSFRSTLEHSAVLCSATTKQNTSFRTAVAMFVHEQWFLMLNGRKRFGGRGWSSHFDSCALTSGNGPGKLLFLATVVPRCG